MLRERLGGEAVEQRVEVRAAAGVRIGPVVQPRLRRGGWREGKRCEDEIACEGRKSRECAVAALRQRVWERDTPTTPPIPSGAAFAAYTLGFLNQDRARVFAHGRWTRLSTETGHVLVL